MKICIFPGSFDPFTKGHLDIALRATKMFDLVYIVVSKNPDKLGTFSDLEKKQIIEESIKDIPNIKVAINEGLTIDFAHSVNAIAIVKGIRNEKDLENELIQYEFNYNNAPDIETILLYTKESLINISSTLVRNNLKENKSIEGLVDDKAIDLIYKLYKNKV